MGQQKKMERDLKESTKRKKLCPYAQNAVQVTPIEESSFCHQKEDFCYSPRDFKECSFYKNGD